MRRKLRTRNNRRPYKITYLGNHMVHSLPPDAFLFDIRIEMTAAKEPIVDKDYAEVILETFLALTMRRSTTGYLKLL